MPLTKIICACLITTQRSSSQSKPYSTHSDAFWIEADQFANVDESMITRRRINIGHLLPVGIHCVPSDRPRSGRPKHRLPRHKQCAVLRSSFHLRHRTNHHQQSSYFCKANWFMTMYLYILLSHIEGGSTKQREH